MRPSFRVRSSGGFTLQMFSLGSVPAGCVEASPTIAGNVPRHVSGCFINKNVPENTTADLLSVFITRQSSVAV